MSGSSIIDLTKAWPLKKPPPLSPEITASPSPTANYALCLPEIVANIVIFLDLRSLTNGQQVCKLWRDEIIKPAHMKQSLFLEAAPVMEVLEWCVQVRSGRGNGSESPPDLRYVAFHLPTLSPNHSVFTGDQDIRASSVVGVLHPALDIHPAFSNDFTRFRISDDAILKNRGKPWEEAFLTQPPCAWKDIWMFEMHTETTGWFYQITYHFPRMGDTLATLADLEMFRRKQCWLTHHYTYFIIDHFVERRHAQKVMRLEQLEYAQG